MSNLFFYGTLRHVPLLELVMGRSACDLSVTRAVLPDHAVFAVQDQPFPMIVRKDGMKADGVLVSGIGEEERARLAFYEGGFDYDLRMQVVTTEDGVEHQAQVFFPDPDSWTPETQWDLDGWVSDWGELSILAADEVMAHYGKVDAAAIARSFPAIRTRAWAKMAARRRDTGNAHDTGRDVIVQSYERAYVDYFAMDEVELRHRKYDGQMGPVLHRSGLMQGSAVIVLPYDPIRDTILLVEQFRAPVFMIDDPEPWMWEPIAGMIDPGETSEQAAHREAMEEAHIKLISLEYAGGAYSSSGSSTEYVYLYVGISNLTKAVEGAGLASEGEDIRSKIIPYDVFMKKVDAHEYKDLPLLSLAHWLDRNRMRLRA